MVFQPRSLRQRTLVFILAPTLLLLISLSIGGFIFVRNMLLTQWGETAVVRLQRTAHLIDMELRKPKDLLLLLQSSDDPDANQIIFTRILKQIEGLDDVVGVHVEWPKEDHPAESMSPVSHMGMTKMPMEMMHGYHKEGFEVGSPRFDSRLGDRTVSLICEFNDTDDKAVGRVEVIISFDTLIKRIINAPWWKSNKAYLVDSADNVLASTASDVGPGKILFPMRSFGTEDSLERKTLAVMKQKNFGTVFGPGSPPEEISGFYHLTEAPWTMVIMAPGEKILQPIIRFKFFYILTLALLYFSHSFFYQTGDKHGNSKDKGNFHCSQ